MSRTDSQPANIGLDVREAGDLERILNREAGRLHRKIARQTKRSGGRFNVPREHQHPWEYDLEVIEGVLTKIARIGWHQ